VVHYNLPFSHAQALTLQMLEALDYLHGDAHLIHGDIQARNIILRIQDLDVLNETEESEFNQPSARKISAETTVFASREIPGLLVRWLGDKSSPVLCDFGEARTSRSSHTGLIQPAPFRAPEVSLQIPWSEPVDVWNLGCITWHLMFGRQLFPRNARTQSAEDEISADINHFARMVALLGHPPPKLLADSGPRGLELFNSDGSPKGEVPNNTFESLLEENLVRLNKSMTEKEREIFLRFMRRTLTWTAGTRATVVELLNDFEPWAANSK